MKNRDLVLKVFVATLLIGATVAFGADDSTNNFTDFTDVVGNADSAAKSTIGTFLQWFIGLLPVLGLAVGIFGGNKFLKKNSNGQEENFAKQLGYMGAGAFIGLIVAILIITAIGVGLMGNSGEAFDALHNFWTATNFKNGGVAQ